MIDGHTLTIYFEKPIKTKLIVNTKEIKSITIEFSGEEVDRIKSTIKKVNEETSSIGFKNTQLNADEIKMIRDLNQTLNP